MRVRSKFFLDLLHLLVQKELPLLFLNVGLDPALDVIFEFENLEFLTEEFHDIFHPGFEPRNLQKVLLLFLLRVHVGGNEMHQEPQRVNVFNGDGCF